MKRLFFVLWLAVGFTAVSQPMTVAEYDLVTSFRIDNLDEDSYVKVNSDYVLDRFQMKPAYYVAGKDGTKNRVDLYSFIRRSEMQELGLLMIYSENGEVKHLCLPYRAESEVWVKYYDDLKYGGRDNPDFAFAVGSVLSREFATMQLSGGDQDDYSVQSSDYDICFPGSSRVTMVDHSWKSIDQVRVGDRILSFKDGERQEGTVTAIEKHEGVYPMVKILASPLSWITASTKNIQPALIRLKATVNHPIMTASGHKPAGDIVPGMQLKFLEVDELTEAKVDYVAVGKSEQKVYNLITSSGNYLVEGVLVNDKE
ncbi:MAG: hypothetical protein JXQ90_05865 [Cyclobacteriaceae bacterium]